MGGSSKDPNKAAMKAQKAQMKRLDAINIPELEEYILQNPELVGLLDAKTIADTKLDEIQLDPKLRENQMKALESLTERSEEGLTASDKYEMEQLLGDVASQRKSAQAGIESEMARRGMDSSGAAERAQRENVQSSANNARDKAMQMAAMAQQNKMGALAQLGQQSGQMNQADFARQAQTASAQDAIARANAMNRQNVSSQNLAARQAIENQRAGTANQQSQVANQIAQQNFQNQISKATGQGSVANSMSQIAGNAPQKPGGLQSALGGAATGASIGNSIVPGVGAGYGAAIGAGAGLLAGMEDGGIVSNESLGESLPIQYRQTAMDAEYREAEQKQHESFKKKYMKRVQDEVMGNSPKPKTPEKPQGKEDGGVIHAQNGVIARTPEEEAVLQQLNKRNSLNRHTSDFDAANAGKAVDSPMGFDTSKATELNRIGSGTILDNPAAKPEDESGISGDALSKGLGALSKIMGSGKEERTPLKLGSFNMDQPENVMTPAVQMQYANPFAAADGGVMHSKGLEMKKYKKTKYEDGGSFYSDGGGDIVDSGMESYAGDRVDAKLNDKEIVVNVPQQQRLMDLIRGKISVDELGTDDIVEGVPREFRDNMHEELEEESESSEKLEGMKALLKMLEK